MNRIGLVLLSILFCVNIFGQTRPDQQPEITSPTGSDAIYSQERPPNNINKIRFDTAKNYFAPEIQMIAKGYTPSAGSIPSSDRNSFIKGSDGQYYYIDKDRDYALLSGVDSIAQASDSSFVIYSGSASRTIQYAELEGVLEILLVETLVT